MTKKTQTRYFPYCKLFIICAIFVFIFSACKLINNFGFNSGVDFAGGIVIETSCNNCNINDIAKQLDTRLKTSISYQKIDNGYIFKTTTTDNYNTILATFKKILEKNNAKIVATDFSSPQMTKTFIDDSILACAFAIICIGLYVIIRFNWKFAISAIITLCLDVLTVITFISIARIEVCLITLTAILTIIGYCINDKIVVLDKINENLDLMGTSIHEIIKNGIKNVLFRSIFTSLTTIIVSVSLLFFNNRAIYEFGITVIFGIIVGTITSICVLPNLLLFFNIKHKTSKNHEKDPMWYAS